VHERDGVRILHYDSNRMMPQTVREHTDYVLARAAYRGKIETSEVREEGKSNLRSLQSSDIPNCPCTFPTITNAAEVSTFYQCWCTNLAVCYAGFLSTFPVTQGIYTPNITAADIRAEGLQCCATASDLVAMGAQASATAAAHASSSLNPIMATILAAGFGSAKSGCVTFGSGVKQVGYSKNYPLTTPSALHSRYQVPVSMCT
jgi:hypothetical protein